MRHKQFYFYIAFHFKMRSPCLLQYSQIDLDPSRYECTAYERQANDNIYAYASGAVPLQIEALLTWSGATPTSIITQIEGANTVALVGTEDGKLLKV